MKRPFFRHWSMKSTAACLALKQTLAAQVSYLPSSVVDLLNANTRPVVIALKISWSSVSGWIFSIRTAQFISPGTFSIFRLSTVVSPLYFGLKTYLDFAARALNFSGLSGRWPTYWWDLRNIIWGVSSCPLSSSKSPKKIGSWVSTTELANWSVLVARTRFDLLVSLLQNISRWLIDFGYVALLSAASRTSSKPFLPILALP